MTGRRQELLQVLIIALGSWPGHGATSKYHGVTAQFDAAVSASVFDMYGPNARLSEDLLTQNFIKRFSHDGRYGRAGPPTR